MIVCKQCGHQNEDDDLFCGNCPAFLEYSGERIGGPEPVHRGGRAGRPTGVGDAGSDTRSAAAICRRPPAGPSAGTPLSPPASGSPAMRGADRFAGRNADRGAAGARHEPATNGRRRWWPSPTRCSRPTRGRRSRRGHRKHNGRKRHSAPEGHQTGTEPQDQPRRPRVRRVRRRQRSRAQLLPALRLAARRGDRRPHALVPTPPEAIEEGRRGRRASGPARTQHVGRRRGAGRAAHAASSSGGSPTSSGSWPCWRSSGSESGSSCRASATG